MVDLGPDAAKARAANENAARVKTNAAIAAKNKDLVTRFGAQGEGGSLSIQRDTYGNFYLNENIQGKDYYRYFVVADNGVDFSIATAAEVLKKYKKDANRTIGLEGLRKKLYETGILNKSEYTGKDEAAFNNAIIQASNNHSLEQVQKYTLNPGQSTYTFVPFSKWLSTKPSSLTPDKPSPDTLLIKTTKVDTDQDIDSFMNDLLGTDATAEEKADYYAKVSAEEAKASKKSTVKGTVETITGKNLNEDDYWRIASTVAAPRLKGTSLEGITKLGGKVAKQVSDLKEYAASMGVKLDSKSALNSVMGGLEVGGSLATGKLDTQRNAIKELSKLKYKNLAESIDKGLSVSDVAREFAQLKGSILELSDSALDAFDPDIEKALLNEGGTGIMSLGDFQRLMYKNPLYGKTKSANETAASYASSILSAFGFMG